MKQKRWLSLFLVMAMMIAMVPAVLADDDPVYVLMNIPYAEFYKAELGENGVDAITSATLNGKARNVNVNGASAIVGAAKMLPLAGGGTAALGAFFEYGDGSFKTHNGFDTEYTLFTGSSESHQSSSLFPLKSVITITEVSLVMSLQRTISAVTERPFES